MDLKRVCTVGFASSFQNNSESRLDWHHCLGAQLLAAIMQMESGCHTTFSLMTCSSELEMV